ncbi:purine nucleosidase [Lentzea waywayandensis]|uniref:Purine nucleosidase n=1 Tax=Lentzea waywayandensis TaxID=84724 RepID=A0A1I6FGB3_9PSEU|nr:nucleoside hydrolase [Lentzea waywayandensis]SFR28934.1 purine nucleosidase [Lentzea waywayandensis]
MSSPTGMIERMRIIVDADPGIDDALALYYLRAQRDTEIVAIGTVHGNVPVQQATANALRLTERLNLNVPVAMGAAKPLAQPLATAEDVHGQDGLGGYAGDEPTTTHTEQSAAEQLANMARENPKELSLLAIGPLTNVALALQIEPRLPELLDKVVVMGGALNVPGNITSHAEANFWHDPEAADLVLAAGFPHLTIVGLDVTMESHAPQEWLDTLPHDCFPKKILGFYADFYGSFLGKKGFVPHDPLAAAILLDPGLASYHEDRFAIELTGRYTRGKIVADQRFLAPESPFGRDIATERTKARYAVTADHARFLDQLRHAVTQP